MYYSTKAQTKNHRHLITGVLDQRQRACRNKKRDGRGHEVHLSVRVCESVRVLSGEGVKAKKQVPIVQAGSNEGGNEGLGFQSCPLQVHCGSA